MSETYTAVPRAFRCRQCGHLVAAEHAGEHTVPHACPVCRGGISFDADDAAARDALVKDMVSAVAAGNPVDEFVQRLQNMSLKKVFNPDNWEVLSDATPERLAELGLTQDQVEPHLPFRTTWQDGQPSHARFDGTPVPNTPQNHFRSVSESTKSTDAT